VKELGLKEADIAPWFPHTQDAPFVRVNVDGSYADIWAATLHAAVRRCYIADELVATSARSQNLPQKAILESTFPDTGSVMAGDFGEIIAYLYHASNATPHRLIGPKKWRLKQDRRKPAPYSDVVQFALPAWPSSSVDDVIHCSEVKTKSTMSAFNPFLDAIADSRKDQVSRLSNTLEWLRERSLTESLGATETSMLDRFIQAVDHPPAARRFYAVVVICSDVAMVDLKSLQYVSTAECTLVVLVVPNLKETYTAVYHTALNSLANLP
jgi:hypothetical protein